jgi:hypothetical protein
MEFNMATVNKSDRKTLVKTQVIGSIVVFLRADTGEEFSRIDVASVTPEMQTKLMVYGAKQVCADVASGADTLQASIEGRAGACDALRLGVWPSRAPAPGSMEPAIAAVMRAVNCTREAAMALLLVKPG